MKKTILLFALFLLVFLSCGVVKVTGEFGNKYQFFIKTKLSPTFLFTDPIGMRDYKDLTASEKEQYDSYCRTRFKTCDLTDAVLPENNH